MKVIKKNGTELNLNSIKPLRQVTNAKLVQSVEGDDYIDITVKSVDVLNLSLGDKISFNGREYFINLNPRVTKTNTRNFQYDMRFEGVSYLLRRVILFNYDSQGRSTSSSFSFTGNLRDFIDLIVNNTDDLDLWSTGTVLNGHEVKTIFFDHQNALLALYMIAQEYETEFDITKSRDTYRINLRERGEIKSYVFEYGRGKGLYSLIREKVDNEDIITRLYAYGSNQNLPIGYRDYSYNLRMPVVDYIENQNLIDVYGYNEGVVVLDDIKPQFLGEVTSVGTQDNTSFRFTCDAMDFDLKERDLDGNTKYLIDGTTAKIHFNSGMLAGYQFEVHDYNHTTKEFIGIKTKDERELVMPNDTAFAINEEDKFVILDIRLPQAYVDNAEQRLLLEANKIFSKMSLNNIKYNLDIDPVYMRDKTLGIGDKTYVKDLQLDVNERIRIVKLEYDILSKKHRLELTNLRKPSFSQFIKNPALQFSLIKRDLSLGINEINKNVIQTNKKIDDKIILTETLPEIGKIGSIYIKGNNIYSYDGNWNMVGGDINIIDDSEPLWDKTFSSMNMILFLKEWGISDYAQRVLNKTPLI